MKYLTVLANKRYLGGHFY